MTEGEIENGIKGSSRLREIHCPWCGGTSLKLKECKGKFTGSVGSCIVKHTCTTCDRDFILVITGDDFFPERGFGLVPEDFNIKFA